MNRVRKVALALICIAITLAGVLVFAWWSQQFPNYLHFQPSVYFSNNFYSIQVSAFVSELRFVLFHMESVSVDVLAFYRAVTLEENYGGRWNLEVLDSVSVVEENSEVVVVDSVSHLFTYRIEKHWVFYRQEPYFTVAVNRTYLFDSENMNNQIIFDVNNQGILSDNRGWLVYNMTSGVVGYRVDSASPDVVSIQTGHPTESQINFYEAKDRDLRSHRKGEQELIQLTIYANQFGSVWDALRFFSV